MNLVVPWSMSWSMFIVLQSIIYNPIQSCVTTFSTNNWFGANCQYKCHCTDNVACNVTNGECPKGCDSGWFGPACQYVDIAPYGFIHFANYSAQSKTTITDGDDITCASLTGSNLSLDINLTSAFYFTWLRIIIGNIVLQKESLSIRFKNDVTAECLNVFVNNVTMDIYCNITEPIQEIHLNGSALGTLCSLYISQGRNVALMQSTTQTSNYEFANTPSSKAVDGSSSWERSSCAMTSNRSESAPTWSLDFKTVVSVTHYTIFNRVGAYRDIDPSCCLELLKGFILRTFDETSNIVQNYTDTETNALAVYNVLSTNPSAPVSTVNITATYRLYGYQYPKSIVALCEVEIYGDSLCLQHTYGRDCENVCNCAVEDEKCFVSTGNCPSGCKAGFYGQGCTKRCDAGYFGVDCRNICSSNCSSCEAVDGNCTSCALKGKKLPSCTQECSYSTYGESCKASCSSNCNTNSTDERICDSESGQCFSGCRNGFKGLDCTITTSDLDNEKDNDKVLASGVGIGIGVTIAAGIVIGIVIFVWFKRRQKTSPKPRDKTDYIYDDVYPIQQNENPCRTVDKSGEDNDIIQVVLSFNKINNSVLIVEGSEIYTNVGGSSVST
ncbi:unnamed protein product [Lymnaea stagnalis]|uniref:Uncharacterized protein n=1 Tax=Lymnaea stagnalis TaxID=6523 RepID=A0AAV2HE50_LYMST